MNNLCLVCEKPVVEHNAMKNVHYCTNARCTRLGVLTVFILIPAKPEAPKEVPKELPKVEKIEGVKNDQNLPKP